MGREEWRSVEGEGCTFPFFSFFNFCYGSILLTVFKFCFLFAFFEGGRGMSGVCQSCLCFDSVGPSFFSFSFL